MEESKPQYILNNIEELLKDSEPSTKKLFRILKKKKPKNLDMVVHEAHEEVFEEIDCLDCGNCCRGLGPRITDIDITRIAKHLKMKPGKFTEEYLELDDDDDYVFKSMPCPFIMPDNHCMIYESRPKACKEYPHTDRKKFFQIIDITQKNIPVCPAVYEIVEKIKEEFVDYSTVIKKK